MVNFGTVTKGQTVSSTVAITNVATTNVFFTGAEISGTSSSDLSDNYNDNAPCGNTSASPLLPGKTCQITASFDPSKTGTENASYKVFDNTVGNPQTLSLTGKGQVTGSNCLHHSATGALCPAAIFLVCERDGTHKAS
jgi:Protein of unknown function (DUF1573)